MRKKLPILFWGILSLLMLMSNDLSAQSIRPIAGVTKAKAVVVSTKEAQRRNDENKQLTSSMLKMKTVSKKSALRSFAPFSTLPMSSKASFQAPAFATGDGTLIYGNVIFASNWTEEDAPVGIYSFPASANTSLNDVAIDENIQANGGGVYVDGKYCFVSYIEFFGMIFASYYIYDAETWEQELMLDASPTSIATDMTYDPMTSSIYGCFYNETLDGYTFSSLDPETGETTKIGDLSMSMVVVAANSKGEIYGISTSGDLYRINKVTGDLTLVGPTGVTPKYLQSGAFDLKTDKLYWAACLSDESSALYEVDVATGVANLISPFSNDEEIVGMYIPAPAAEDGAPAVVEDLTADFVNDATTGTVEFTLPVKTFGGNALTGSLSYSILFNDKEMATGTANAGTQVNEHITVEPGMYKIVVITSNSVGRSPVAKTERWIGKDAPKAVKNVKLVNKDYELVLTWDAPAEGVHSGYLDVAALNYKVVRYPEDVVVADKLKETTFTEGISVAELSNYWYGVTAYSGDLKGETVASNKIILGTAFKVPYFEGFDDESDFDLFTIIDANKDGETWSFDAKNSAAKCSYSSDLAMDDWLITPPVKLDIDRVYKFYFRTKTASAMFPEKLKVALGNDGTVEAMSTVLLPATDITSATYTTIEKVIKVTVPGDYYIGFQCCSDPDMFNLYVDSIGIENGAKLKAPGQVTDLKAVAGENGALEATVSFKTPAKAVDETSLESLLKMDIYRGDELIKTFDHPAVNAELTFVDKKAEQGNNLYKVIASNAEGEGMDAKVIAYVGIDTPDVPVNIFLKEIDGKAVLTWEAPVQGAAGGYINPSALLYTVVRATDKEIVAESISALTFADSPDMSAGQALMAYYVFAESTAGVGLGAISNSIIMGDPHQLPFKESFTAAALDNGPWGVTRTGQGKWSLYEAGENPDVSAQDNDGGLASFAPEASGEESLLYSGKISLAGSIHPTLEFYYYLVAESSDKLIVEISKEGDEYKAVKTIDFATASDNEGWRKVSIPLDDFISAKYIQLGFHAIAGDDESNLHVDNIRIKDLLDYNLALTSISAPKKMKVGEVQEIKVTVTNEGAKEATGYNVELFRDGKMVSMLMGDALAPDAVKGYVFTEIPDLDFGESVTYYALITYEADMNPNNNKSAELTVPVIQPVYPAVSDLNGICENGKAVLTWSEPNFTTGVAEPITDYMEEYAPFIIDNIGEWTVVDVDPGENGTYGISDGAGGIIQYENAGAAMAFQVFNPSAAGIAVVDDSGAPTIWAPYSGDQMLAAFADADGQNDDWLISPELPGTAQTLSFYLKSVTGDYGLETYEIQISSTNKDLASFQNVSDASVIKEAPLEWTNVTVDLPEGTKYFAIRCTSPDRFALLVDDITYIPSSAAPVELSLVGYNVYRDDSKITDEPITATTYTDAVPESGEYKYKVTTVYDKGESVYSNEVTVNVVGVSINNVYAEGASVRGIRHAIEIRDAVDMDIYIYTIQGKLVYKGSGKSVSKVPVADGEYIVKAGDKTVKVLVK